ncbi:hypothetical protein BgAZ_104540 [Babesia gibsoni]|uniref:Eukaryotic translation initiation factor 3 subunit K n=1 Tax=Babesia gibsoni TaxID=33632 RepID=A0AAD8PFK9_BABGI|nr:hypothetical protein BgAZ_104540 [Babesia gibsoni]
MEHQVASESRIKAEAILESPALRFSIGSLHTLIEFLDEQMTDANTYSIQNNLGILKIYTLYPYLSDTNVIQKILIQCLTQLPANDFNVCLAQVPLPVQEQPAIAQLINLHNVLQNCMFSTFWAESLNPVADNASLPVIDVPGIKESARRFVLDVVPLVYLHISVPEMRTLLNYKDNCEEFENLLLSRKWTLEGDYKREDPNSGICIPATKQEVMKPQKGGSQQKSVEKHFRTESLRHYLTTMRNPVN